MLRNYRYRCGFMLLSGLALACAPAAGFRGPALGGDAGLDPVSTDLPPDDDSPPPPPSPRDVPDTEPEVCETVRAEADAVSGPADIIWIVDNSGSMSEEASLVQENINNFAGAVDGSGVDFRVVMITAPGFVTVPDPLGSDATRYRFIGNSVNSHDAFQVLLSSYNQYDDFLRPDSALHIVVVTDDESDTSYGRFGSDMRGLLGGRDFTFHAIASENAQHCTEIPILGSVCQPGCEGPHGEAADVGAEYYGLAGETGGTTFSICASDWLPLFDTLRDSVVSSVSLPCNFELPDLSTFDPTEVNVVITAADGTESTVPSAGDADSCGGAMAWFFDDPAAPTRIVLCPAACDQVESAGGGGSIDIALGCPTEFF